MMFKKQNILGVGLVLLLVLMIAPLAAAQGMLGITVSDQAIDSGTITIDSVSSDGPGWIVVHADDGGAPGSILGQTAVTDGENQNVTIEIDPSMATDTLYVMLHTDAGEEGVFEPSEDEAVMDSDNLPVVQSFSITGGLLESSDTMVETDTMAQTDTMTQTDTVTDTAATDESPEVLPATGGVSMPWLVIGLVLIGALLAVSGLALARRSA
jgi:hypothetical protein